MKTQFFSLSMAVVFMLSLFSACDTQEPLLAEAPDVVRLEISGRTATALELLYNGKVIDTLQASDGGFNKAFQLPVNNQNDELLIREKESAKVIVTRKVKPSPFKQTLFYEDGNVYDQRIDYNVKGYATSGELEFVMDERIVAEGSMVIVGFFPVYLNEGEKKEFQVRVKGETDALITKSIEATSEQQSFTFFFDGTTIIDGIPAMTPPKDSSNMSLTATFKSLYAAAGSIPMFTGDAEVDIIFFMTDGVDVVRKPDPEVHITVPTDGRFVTFELTPPPEGMWYTYDIYKKGSKELPYKDFDLSGGNLALNEGRAGRVSFGTVFEPYYFKAGSSKLILLQDYASGWYTFPPDYSEIFTVVHGDNVMDLTDYFE